MDPQSILKSARSIEQLLTATNPLWGRGAKPDQSATDLYWEVKNLSTACNSAYYQLVSLQQDINSGRLHLPSEAIGLRRCLQDQATEWDETITRIKGAIHDETPRRPWPFEKTVRLKASLKMSATEIADVVALLRFYVDRLRISCLAIDM